MKNKANPNNDPPQDHLKFCNIADQQLDIPEQPLQHCGKDNFQLETKQREGSRGAVDERNEQQVKRKQQWEKDVDHVAPRVRLEEVAGVGRPIRSIAQKKLVQTGCKLHAVQPHLGWPTRGHRMHPRTWLHASE